MPPSQPEPKQAGMGITPHRSGCSTLALVFVFVISMLMCGSGGVLVAYASVARGLPSPEDLHARASNFSSTLIYDREGGLLSERGDPAFGRRTVVPLDQISAHLKDATIATEDPNFYQHPGVDPIGILRAISYAIRERDTSGPGGSTITQQLVKLTFLSPERTLSRKIKEAILAAELTRRYPKDTILQIYLNELNYGNGAYGIEAAAETYFGKPAATLTLAEATLLAGLPQAPAYYDPYTRLWEGTTPGPVKRRQGVVLGLMVKHGYITSQEADAAWGEPIKLKPLAQSYSARHPHFVQYAASQVEQALGPELAAKGGLRIYTTLDPRIQVIAEEEVARQVAALASQAATNAALVSVRPATGEVLAMVGSAGFDNEKISGQINMALVPRQPGSAIKPFTYLAAFEMPAAVSQNPADAASAKISAIEPPGYWTPGTAILDIRTEFPDSLNRTYVPLNYDEKEHGLVTVRSALANSYNIPAVKALQHVGLERLKDVARRAGITSLTRPDYGLSLTLGGGEVTLLEMTGAYAVLANNGTRVPLTPIACVLDNEGKLIWRGAAADAVAGCTAAPKAAVVRALALTPSQNALNPQHVYLMTSILGDMEARRPMFGANAALLSLPDRPSAAKTGTTNDYRDAWTMGYTPDLAVGVWVGNADYKPMQKVAGSIGAAPIWQNTMRRSLQGSPAQQFLVPPGIQRVRVCADSGTLPSEVCPTQREELFAEGQGPLPASYDLHQSVRVDRVTGKPATDFTPAERIEERVAVLFPPQYRAWAESHGYPQLAAAAPTYEFAPEVALRSPADGSLVVGLVQVAGRVRIPAGLVWKLEYGVGPNPIGWGVLAGPTPGDIDGLLTNWDTARTIAEHNVQDYSLRLAVYDPGYSEYPVAASNAAYVRVFIPSPTATATARPTATPTASPTATASRTPPPTATAAPTAAPTATPTPRPTQAATAVATMTAPPPTVAPTATATSPSQATGRALITEPRPNSRVSGEVTVSGTATATGFVSYLLEYAAGAQPAAAAWLPVAPPQSAQVTEGGLGVWQTQGLPPGPYTLRLRVFDRAGVAASTQMLVELRE